MERWSQSMVTTVAALAVVWLVALGVALCEPASVTLAWDAVRQYPDGSPVPDLASYQVDCGRASRTYDRPPQRVSVPQTRVTIGDLVAGQTYFCAVKAYDRAGQESAYSDEVSFTATDTPLSQIAIHAGGGAYTAADGTLYLADDGYVSGGAKYTTTAPIQGTPDPGLYQSERFGDFTYTFPLANGDYLVRFRFAEIYHQTSGQRVFTVQFNGVPVLENFDILSRVARNTALDVTLPAHVTTGSLATTFITVKDNAKVAAIAIRTWPGPYPRVIGVDSEEVIAEPGDVQHLIDGLENTLWVTQYRGHEKPYPHTVTVDLGQPMNVLGFRYLPRQDGNVNGTIVQYAFYVCLDILECGEPQLSGTLAKDTTEKIVKAATPKQGRYIRLVAQAEINGNHWASAAELSAILAP
jgi:Malectin domain/F5/8 type C domain